MPGRGNSAPGARLHLDRVFQRRYKAELRGHGEELERLRAIAAKGTLTLVYAARDEERNDAVVLRDVLLHGN
jgi:uncharacterized protein YeaO (DUF488 family)